MLFLLLFLPLLALAGHASWEPKRSQSLYKRDVNSAGHLDKRWFVIANWGSGREGRPWPAKTIIYSFADDDARNTLKDPVVQAMKIWHAAKLPEEFKMLEDTDNKYARADKVIIKSSKWLDSSVGKIAADPTADPPIEGPSMNLVLDGTVGMLDPIANIAHEIGHAWGLYHEHQRRELWTGDYDPSGIGTQTFKFNCEALKDYETVQQKLADKPDVFKECCLYRSVAAENDFSASQFLPEISRGKSPGYGEPVDKDSLMIYASGCGGKGSASSPDDDNRADVITYLDGSKIPVRQAPSQGDINALIKLYDGIDMKLPDTLINEKGNKLSQKFRKLVGKVKGSGHCV